MQKVMLGFIVALIVLTLYSLVDIIASSGKDTEPSLTSVIQPPSQAVSAVKKQERFSVQEKKEHFIQTILPAVLTVKQELDTRYEKVKTLSSKQHRSASEEAWLESMKQQYNVDGIPCLLRRLHTHPVSLVIAQAALETGWGSSRFFKKANNIFGIWSYHADEARIPAAKQRGEKTIYVKKFASYEDAVRGYFKMVASGYAYSAFRKARMRTDDPFALLRHLRHYSELRDEYVARLYYVIIANELYNYDTPAHKPVALAEIIPEYVAMKHKKKAKTVNSEQQILALNEIKVEPEISTDTPKPCDAGTLTTLQAPEHSTAAPEGSSVP